MRGIVRKIDSDNDPIPEGVYWKYNFSVPVRMTCMGVGKIPLDVPMELEVGVGYECWVEGES